MNFVFQHITRSDNAMEKAFIYNFIQPIIDSSVITQTYDFWEA